MQGALAEEPFVVAAEADAGEATGTIYLAAPVSREAVEASLGHLIEEDEEISWEGWTPRARRLRRVGRVVLRERVLARPDRAVVERAALLRLREQGLRVLPWSERCVQLLERLRHAERSGRVAGLPGWSEEELTAGVEDWLLPFLRRSGGPLLDEGAVERALRARIAGPAAAALSREAPESLVLPSGSRRAIRYGEGDPHVDARIQELFGMAASPAVCGAPLVFRLLSPAGRPLQITSDLASFWRSAYPELRGSLRARYPKHAWPEDPLAARPVSGPRRRRER